MVTEDLPPLPVGLVRGEDRRGLLIPPGDQTEETVGTFAVEGQVSHLIDDQEMKLRERLNPLFKFVLPVRFHQPLNETGCIRILHPEPLCFTAS